MDRKTTELANANGQRVEALGLRRPPVQVNGIGDHYWTTLLEAILVEAGGEESLHTAQFQHQMWLQSTLDQVDQELREQETNARKQLLRAVGTITEPHGL